jgi:hypothetical protein
MKEEFLHFVWKHGLFLPGSLKDATGNAIEVISPGDYNRDAGPDFFNARLRIAGTVWAGNVEIHIRSSDFEVHGHHRDHSFDNVILHAVYENDRRVRNARGEEVLTSALQIDDAVYEKYLSMINNPCSIACQEDIGTTDRFLVNSWLHSLEVERLAEKAEAVAVIFNETGNDWEETLYRTVCRYFGFRVNTGPFEMLASALPYRIIRKHADNRLQVEALLFGTAGMLDEGLFRAATEDAYFLSLAREYRVLSAKYSLKPVHGWLWKFSRLRPVNFPTLRISQLASMLSTAGGLFSRVTGACDTGQVKALFEVSSSAYWDEHYLFGKKSRPVGKRTGSMATSILLINSVIPVLFAYGVIRKEQSFKDKAIDLLESLEPEDNTIIADWIESGIEPQSAFDSQALIQLRGSYCKKRRCLECRIGAHLISNGRRLKDPGQLVLERQTPLTDGQI